MSINVIKVEYNPTPIPARMFDYHAWVVGTEDEDAIVGWGATAEDAVEDLKDKLEQKQEQE